jgi:enediyne biosynthesis protein E4
MSYRSARSPRIHFGMGKRTKIESLDITWPSGQVNRLTDIPIDRIIAIKKKGLECFAPASETRQAAKI